LISARNAPAVDLDDAWQMAHGAMPASLLAPSHHSMSGTATSPVTCTGLFGTARRALRSIWPEAFDQADRARSQLSSVRGAPR